jgi:perosamine synthetase
MSRLQVLVASVDGSGNEEYVVDALRSFWISSTGPYIQRFKKAWLAEPGGAARLR